MARRGKELRRAKRTSIPSDISTMFFGRVLTEDGSPEVKVRINDLSERNIGFSVPMKDMGKLDWAEELRIVIPTPTDDELDATVTVRLDLMRLHRAAYKEVFVGADFVEISESDTETIRRYLSEIESRQPH